MLKRLKTHAFIFSICLVVTCLMGGQQIFANATASDHDRYAADLSLAAKTCPARATISALARKVLEGRNGLRRIQSGWFGTEAAYLLIHYGELEAAEILKLFDRAQDARIARIGELRAAYEIASSLRLSCWRILQTAIARKSLQRRSGPTRSQLHLHFVRINVT